MDIVRLVEYIREWELFDKIDFDQIVSDYDFDMDDVIHIRKISDLANVKKDKKTLFILDRLLVENISDFFDMNNISIIDLNAWLFSYGNKLWFSKYDIINLINDWFNVFEPVDLFTMLAELDITGKNYIRVSNLDVHSNFVESNFNNIISLDNKWFSEWNMTLVSTWIMLSELVRLWNFLKEQWIHARIKVLNKLNFDETKPLDDDENIVFILDLWNNKWYESYLKNLLKNKNLNFIYPTYQNISTILDEYKMEEAEFDVLNLANKILQK